MLSFLPWVLLAADGVARRPRPLVVAGLAVGLRRDESVRFSFLLSLPAICGAALLELRHAVVGAGVVALVGAEPLLAVEDRVFTEDDGSAAPGAGNR